MASTVSEDRLKLARFCSSRDWSKAIRVIDSILSDSCVIQDICNRAFCYSQLELHKHVIKDCDKVLQLDPTLLQAYILKGRALSALGRKEEALVVWEEGYEYAVRHAADLKQLLELEELLAVAKQSNSISSQNHVTKSSGFPATESGSLISSKSSEICNNDDTLTGKLEPHSESGVTLEAHNKSSDGSYKHKESNGKVKGYRKIDGQPNGSHDCPNLGDGSEVCSTFSATTKPCTQSSSISSKSNDKTETRIRSNGSFDNPKLGDVSEVRSSFIDTFESCNQPSTMSIKSIDKRETRSKSSEKAAIHIELSDQAKRSKKLPVTRIPKIKSINVDFRLSRGIAQVNEGKYNHAISIFDQILREEPAYPEALIGRGTAYAFQRELDSAIIDFSKALLSNPSAGEAWKRRGQARAALGESVEAIADLTKALEFEPNSADILHERGKL